jgi:hypothetical protein
MKIRSISISGETHHRLEDFSLVNLEHNRLKAAVGDWANNLVGGPYAYPEVLAHLEEKEGTLLNGGVIGSILARETIRASESIGLELINEINKRIRRAYETLGIRNYKQQRELTFTGYIAHIIANAEQMHITAVGDVRVAVDGKVVVGKTKKIDEHNAQLRKEYIARTGDVEGSFDFIKPSNILQFQYQNTPGHEFSYPAIDGTKTLPKKEIEMLTLPTPKKILMWTDGYLTPNEFSIEGLERKLAEVYAVDPQRCKAYPGVNHRKDDRTALEITFDNFDRVEYID